jgi:hypothetical protein
MKALASLTAAGLALLLAGCVGLPADALKLPPDSLANRQMQSRAFDGLAEPAMLSACAGVLQDLGFTLVESETKLGVIVATKERSAVKPGEVAAMVALGLVNFIWDPLFQQVTYSKRQVIQASLVTQPLPGSTPPTHRVRITFQRRTFDNKGLLIRTEKLNEPALYTDFYARLAQSVNLEALSP